MVHNVAFLFVAILGFALAQGLSLHGPCESNDDCGVIDSYCNNGTCVCKPSFAFHHDSCIQLVDPRMGCVANSDCQPSLGDRSICKDASCACLPSHHLHKRRCIKNRGLNERCDDDFECYWGQEMIERMGCISGECVCKSGYKPYQHRKCQSGANSNFALSLSMISAMMLTLLCKLF